MTQRIKLLADYNIRIAGWGYLAILAYLPFHIFISTVGGVNIGYLEVWKVSKDVFVALLCLLILPYIFYNKDFLKRIIRDRLVIASLLFIGLNLLFFAFLHADLDSSFLAALYNTRYLAFFLVGIVLVRAVPNIVSAKNVAKIIIITGTMVAVIGILQYFVLPADFFQRLGYSMQSGALPWFYIDDKTDFLRIMSTMRDPNTLGSYLLIPIALIASQYLVAWSTLTKKQRYLLSTCLVALLLALILAFSRSGLVGLMVMMAVLFGVRYAGELRKHASKVSIVVAVLVVVAAGSAAVFRDTYVFKNVVFHADEQTVLKDPNELRIEFLVRSVDSIVQHPLGQGLGTAGLASMKNDITGVNLTENYYLQIGLEMGLAGLILFLYICGLLAYRLYKRWFADKDYIALATLAAFGGLFITNTLAHIWTNETIALTWWGLAAVILFGATSKTGRKKAR